MPIFEYRCTSCGHEFELLVRTGVTPACPSCRSADLEKLLSMPAIKSESTHDLAMRAAKKRDKAQASQQTRERIEYERAHDD
jgi:putative FmdB family regulatory protein